MSEEEVKKLESYLSRHGLSIAQTNDYLRRLDRKVFINPSVREHKEVEQHVSAFLEAFLQEVGCVVPDLIIKVIESGSYFSNLRVGRPYEFDFMLEIPMTNIMVKRIGRSVYYCIYLEDISGIQWIEEVVPLSHIVCEGDMGKYILVSEIMENMSRLFYHCLSNLAKKWNLVKFELEQNSPALEVYMKYQGKAISMDLVPCVHFPQGQKEEIPEMRSELYELVLKIIQLHPDSLKGLTQTGSELAKPVNMENITDLVNQSLYLTFREAEFACLSTSVLEKFIFLGIKDDWLVVLRLLKYLLQTFHIPPTSTTAPYLQRLSGDGNEFGYSPAMPSRYVTVMYLNHFISNPDVVKSETIFSDPAMLTLEVMCLLHTLHFGGLTRIQEISYSGLFCKVDNNTVKNIATKSIEKVFHYKNTESLENFLLKAIAENCLDVMCLQSVNNNVKCEKCWGEDMEEMLKCYDLDYVTGSFPVKFCYLHGYLEDQSVLVYNRQDQSVLVYSRLCGL